MTDGVRLHWEQTHESWRGKRNGVVVALVVPQAENGRILWTLRAVNTFQIAPGAGTAATVDAAKEAAETSWNAWCRALGLEAAHGAKQSTARAA